MGKSITARDQDFSQWYLDLVRQAGLAENSDVRGCMIIKPYGYSIWENMQKNLDKMFKDTGHSNAYFPLFVPKSYLAREASHVEGFAKECAVITHYRLKETADNKGGIAVDPEAALDEELIVRPTSETMVWNSYKKWIQSYRDLPLLINQWANVVRWEMRPRLFLRTSEFLWQEGHTAHAKAIEAEEETLSILDIYANFAENFMAMPVIKGRKSESEKFPGAVNTYCIEALMQDGKALQAGTSHFLGQNFAKAFDVRFAGKDGRMEYVWGTSWGVSTRLIGGLIMTHADDDGLIIPPKLAPIHVVIIPIFKNEEDLQKITAKAMIISKQLKKQGYAVKFDDSDMHKPGFKFAEYELKGIPIRITLGPRDLENGVMEVVRRDTKEKNIVPFDKGIEQIPDLLEDIQRTMYQRALCSQKEKTTRVDSYADFKQLLDDRAGFLLAHWDGSPETEAAIKEDTKATIRCIPDNTPSEEGKCIYSGKFSQKRVLFARAY